MASPSPHRTVRHLRVACRHPDQARHTRVLLTDALRTATLDDHARLVVVRQLHLGSLPRDASATQLSRRLEQRWALLHPDLVSVHSPSAPHARAVFFHFPEEPWYLLADRTARGIPCQEWFWPLALPTWNRHQPSDATLRQSFHTLAALPHGLLHSLHLAHLLHSHRTLPTLLHALTPPDLAPLHSQWPAPLPLASLPHAVPPSPPHPASSPHPLPHPQPHPPAHLLDLGLPFARAWGPDDPRTLWLAFCLASLECPSAPTRPSPTPIAIPPTDRIARCFSQLVGNSFRPQPTASVDLHPIATSHPKETLDAPSSIPTTPTYPAPASPPTRPAGDETGDPQPPAFAHDRLPTLAGGVFFLIPLFQRLGLPAHLQSLDEPHRQPFVGHLFRLALRHARIPDQDPILEMFPAPLAPTSRPGSPSPASFLLRAHHQLRHLDNLTLRELIRRPALLSSSPTHLDLFFRPGDADLRIRRAALDADPGFIRWLARVITYHYTRDV